MGTEVKVVKPAAKPEELYATYRQGWADGASGRMSESFEYSGAGLAAYSEGYTEGMTRRQIALTAAARKYLGHVVSAAAPPEAPEGS